MRLQSISAAIALAAMATSAAVSAQDFTGKRIHVALDGDNNVAPGAGDPDGTGTATLRINPGQKQICYTLRVDGIDGVFAAHIHEGGVTETGPAVVTLEPPIGGVSSGCATVTRELALEILQMPEDYYINVHTNEFPAGAVRGQVGM